jgi:hypothetical protein
MKIIWERRRVRGKSSPGLVEERFQLSGDTGDLDRRETVAGGKKSAKKQVGQLETMEMIHTEDSFKRRISTGVEVDEVSVTNRRAEQVQELFDEESNFRNGVLQPTLRHIGHGLE